MSGRTTKIWIVAACALTGAVLTGCPGEPTPAPSNAPTPSPTASSSPGISVSKSPALQQVSGTVRAGVESGCLLLSRTDGGGDWLLIGQRGSIKVGDQVTVEGRPDPAAVTTCQQGTPFVVVRVL